LLLYSNQLEGEIPESIGNLMNLTNLNLHSNQLSGEIPQNICELSNIDDFGLQNNQLCPPYPECLSPNDVGIQNLDNCNEVVIECEDGYIESNYFCYYQTDLDVLQGFIDNSGSTLNMNMDVDSSGVIEPLELCYQNWKNGRMTYLTCFNKGLSGVIPENIGNLTNLTTLSLYYSQLTGEIPSEIGNLTNLTSLYLQSNQLTGEIPSEIGNLTNLTSLNLSGNQFTGEIPPEIGNLTNLNTLYLYSNQLTGEIPPEIGNLTNLTRLWLLSNQLTGEIPSEIGTLTNLTSLRLDFNQLTGEIPSEIGTLTNLTSLRLVSNQLTGKIPPEIGNLTNLTYLNLSGNQLTYLPESICNLPSYLVISLSNNQLCPPYPECLSVLYDIGGQDTTNCSLSNNNSINPLSYNLSNPYPNPFNPTTTISFSIPQSDMVSLNVYDITGKLITTLINEQLNIGYHSIDWDGTNQSSGMYLVRMESGEYVETQKLLLVK